MDEKYSSMRRHWARDIPSLTVIAAIEASARTGSFKLAARELDRTPSAISHSIRDFEKKVGVELFERVGRNVTLTVPGQIFIDDAMEAIHFLRQAANNIVKHAGEPDIRVSAPPLFVAAVLIPRMSEFESLYPPYRLRIETTSQIVSLTNSGIDVGIRFSEENDASLDVFDLPRIVSAPVVSPTYKENYNLQTDEDLTRARLIRLVQYPSAWHKYFRQTGTPVDELDFVDFDSTVSALEAARRNIGVSLGIFPIVQYYPGFGTDLVQVGPTGQPETGYRFVCNKSISQTPKICAFRKWLTEDAW